MMSWVGVDRPVLAAELDVGGNAHGLPAFPFMAWLHFRSGCTGARTDREFVLDTIDPDQTLESRLKFIFVGGLTPFRAPPAAHNVGRNEIEFYGMAYGSIVAGRHNHCCDPQYGSGAGIWGAGIETWPRGVRLY